MTFQFPSILDIYDLEDDLHAMGVDDGYVIDWKEKQIEFEIGSLAPDLQADVVRRLVDARQGWEI